MAPITRRRFVAYTAGFAALRAHTLKALADTRRGSEAPAPDAAHLDAAAVRKLASQTAGRVITPDSPDYELSRLVFNRAFDKHPALIVRCANAEDIARALEFAQDQHLRVAVRAGGHNRAALSTCDGGVVIDLSAMNRVDVDAGARVARAQGGALTVHFDAATQRFGLAAPLAGCPTVGIAGLTLGGGMGLLMAIYGAACDNLISAQLVTADGGFVEANKNSNPDLFWAIRGGGGNFGVATALEFRLHPVSSVLAGKLIYPPGRTPELVQAFVKCVATLPDEMRVLATLVQSERGPRFQMSVCHVGDAREGNKLLGPMRALEPQEDSVRVTSYLETQATLFAAAPIAHFQTTLFLPDLSAAATEALTAAASNAPPNARVFIAPINGAVTRVKVTDTAFPLRQRGFELDIMGAWAAAADSVRAVRWVDRLRDNLKPLARGLYVNQLGETSEELVRSAYGANYARLAAIKKKYDPRNVLRSNQNILPG
jgi:FAD/FMN-containing dehydrogenase